MCYSSHEELQFLKKVNLKRLTTCEKPIAFLMETLMQPLLLFMTEFKK